MIYKLYPSLNDYENLSRLKVKSSDFANTFDYKNVVVNKPWGYEYLWFQNNSVAIWFLYIKKDHSTSLHCHARKRTSLIVLDGMVECTTLDDKYPMRTLEGIVLEACVFHSTSALSDNGAFIMEIETPPMKGDLIRMNDSYGRQQAGYESTGEYSTDYSLYEFYPFESEFYNNWKFRNVSIKLSNKRADINDSTHMIVPINGYVKLDDKVVISSGESVLCESDIPIDKIEHPDYQFLLFNFNNH